jgi:hypothetical protein
MNTKILIYILLPWAIITSCSSIKPRAQFAGSMQTEQEKKIRTKFNCPAVSERFCKDSTSECTPVYISNLTKSECSTIDEDKIKRICGSAKAYLFYNQEQCQDQKFIVNCPDAFSPNMGIQNIHKCPGLYNKMCSQVCGARYDTSDVRPAWQLSEDDIAVSCIDNSLEKMKNGIEFEEDRKNHGCYDGKDAEIHKSGGSRNWCVKLNYEYMNTKLGAYFQCVSRLK